MPNRIVEVSGRKDIGLPGLPRLAQLLVISQNARLAQMDIPSHAVLRVNAAWVKSKDELAAVLGGIKNDVFLDLPEGRRKPPRPTLKLADLVEAMRRFPRVKYFGATDVRDADRVRALLKLLPPGVQLVPKIESREGVENVEEIAGALPYQTRYVMLDKEDLYTAIDGDNRSFLDLLDRVRETCRRAGVHVLELAGVIFVSDPAFPKRPS